MYGTVWHDGHFKPYEGAHAPIFSHSICYASSVYEGIRAYEGKIFELEAHLKRLRRSADIFHHSLPYDDQTLKGVAEQLLRTNNLPDGYVKVQIYYGDEDTGFSGRGCTSHILISAIPKPKFPHTKPFSLAKADWRRPSAQCHPYTAKTSSTYALSFLSFRKRPDWADDVLFTSEEDVISESSGANVFFVRGTQLYTPKIDMCLDGITRRVVREQIARHAGIETFETDIHWDDVSSFDGCFLCGTAVEIREVSRIGEHFFMACPQVELIAQIYNQIVRTPHTGG